MTKYNESNLDGIEFTETNTGTLVMDGVEAWFMTDAQGESADFTNYETLCASVDGKEFQDVINEIEEGGLLAKDEALVGLICESLSEECIDRIFEIN